MPLSPLHFLLLATVVGALSAAPDSSADAPWTKTRDMAAFQSLLARSPFSLPTAEESSPLAERFSLTGAADINGETMVFVIDRTTQNRQMVKKANAQTAPQSMTLVEYMPDPDPRKMKATIRVDGQISTIAFSESAMDPQQQAQQPAVPGQPGKPGQATKPTGQTTNTLHLPNSTMPPQPSAVLPLQPTAVVKVPAPVPGSPAFQPQGGPSPSPSSRRVIHRLRNISGPQTPGQ